LTQRLARGGDEVFCVCGFHGPAQKLTLQAMIAQ